MKFDHEGARKAGYSDLEIAQYLAGESGFDLDGAINAGYDPSEVLTFLTQSPEKPSLRQRLQNQTNEYEDQVGMTANYGDDANQAAAAYRKQELTAERAAQPGMSDREYAEYQANRDRSGHEFVRDTSIAVASGIQQLGGAVPGLLAPDSDMAKRMGEQRQRMQEQLSPQLQGNLEFARIKIEEAAKEGRWEEVKAAMSEYLTDPALAFHFTANTLPSMVPVLGGAKVAELGAMMAGMSGRGVAMAGLGGAGLANAALNAGSVRQDSFDDLKQVYLKAGLGEEAATERALAESRGAAAVGGITGFAGGVFGAEAQFLTKGVVQAFGRGGMTAAIAAGTRALAQEIGTELAEEVGPQIVTNIIAGQTDGRDMLDGVPETVAQTIAGTLGMGSAGAVRAGQNAYDPLGDELRSMNAEVEGRDFSQRGIIAEANHLLAGGAPSTLETLAPRTPAPAPDPTTEILERIGSATSSDEVIAAAQAINDIPINLENMDASPALDARSDLGQGANPVGSAGDPRAVQGVGDGRGLDAGAPALGNREAGALGNGSTGDPSLIDQQALLAQLENQQFPGESSPATEATPVQQQSTPAATSIRVADMIAGTSLAQGVVTNGQQQQSSEPFRDVDLSELPDTNAGRGDVASRAEGEAVQALAAAFGSRARLVVPTGAGVAFDGITFGDNIVANVKSKNILGVTVAHELGHVIENQGNDAWATFEGVVMDEAKVDLRTDDGLLQYAQDYAPSIFQPKDIKARLTAGETSGQILDVLIPKIGPGYDRNAIRKEFAKDVFGNAMMSDGFMGRVVSKLAKMDVPLLKTVIDTITKAINVLRGNKNRKSFKVDQMIKNLERVRDAAATVAAKQVALKDNMAKRTVPELLAIANKNPDADRRDAAQAELKRRETESAAKQMAAGARQTAQTRANVLGDNETGQYSPDRTSPSEKRGTNAPGSDIGHKRTKSGDYVGAPEGMTPAKLGALRTRLRKLTEEGVEGRMWYEESSDAILAAAEGDTAMAEKISGLLAIYSPNATVSGNTTMGLKALYQWANGEKIKVRFPVQDEKAQAWMDGTIDENTAMQIKTGNFHRNLMRKIDEENYGYDKQGATIDMWMARVFGYGSKAIGSDARYYFAERETKRLAKEMGWEPQQVQAALWVATKARVDAIRNQARDIGIKKDWLKKVEKNGNISWEPKNAEMRELYEGKILELALKADRSVTDEFIHKGVYNFATALKERVGQISWEAIPGKTTGVLPGIFDAPLAQQAEYLHAIDAAMRDNNGVDLIAKKLNLPVLNTAFGPSAWQMNVGAGAQTEVTIPAAKGEGVAQPAKDLINTYAAIRGLVLNQEAVVWHLPIFSAAKKDANGVQLDFGRDPTHDEVTALYREIYNRTGRDDWAPAYVPGVGVRVLNFSDVPHTEFHKLIKEAAQAEGVPDFHFATFKADGDYIGNDWTENPDGAQYKEVIDGQDSKRVSRGSGRSDLQGWVEGVLRPRVERVNREFAEKYGWDKPATQYSPTRSGTGNESGEGSTGTPGYGTGQPGSVSLTGVHYSKAQRSTLAGHFYGQGMKGAEGERLRRESASPEQLRRVHFYVDEGKGIRPESDVGDHAHRVQLGNLYNWGEDPLNLWPEARAAHTDPVDRYNKMEQLIIERGFDGLYGPEAQGNQGVAVLLGKKHVAVPVEYVGTGYRGGDVKPQPAKPQAKSNTAADKVANARTLPLGQMTGADWKRVVPMVVPGVDVSMLDDTKTYYKDDVVSAMQRGPQFSPSRTIEVDGVDRPATNSNGQPIHPTEEGVRNFWRWFGDSKVVDAQGRPLVVYHGTNADIGRFDPEKVGSSFGKDERGFFFTSNPTKAARYADTESVYALMGMRVTRPPQEGANTIPVYIKSETPLTLEKYTDAYYSSPDTEVGDEGISVTDYYDDNTDSVLEMVDRDGHDGVLFNYKGDALAVAFDPTQIKSAIGNQGTFDGSNPDIRYSPSRNADTKAAINRAVDDDFTGIVARMKKAGVLVVEC